MEFSPMRQLGVCTGNRNNPKLTHGAGRHRAVRVNKPLVANIFRSTCFFAILEYLRVWYTRYCSSRVQLVIERSLHVYSKCNPCGCCVSRRECGRVWPAWRRLPIPVARPEQQREHTDL